MSPGRDHPREFRHSFVERHVFKSAAGNDEIERIVGEGKRQKISLSESYVAGAAGTLLNSFSGGGDRGC